MSKVRREHGAGGELMESLIKEELLPNLTMRGEGSVTLDDLDDGATFPSVDGEMVMTTDAHIVDPPFFPGGDVGKLAAAGTANDLAVMGARPVAFACSIVVREGFPIDDLKRVYRSIDEVLSELGAHLITGDTKVGNTGDVDIVVTMTGVGEIVELVRDRGLRPGDKIVVTGTVGDHGMAILAAQQGLETDLESDVAPVWEAVNAALEVGGVTSMKDPTRGGLAGALNEMAEKSGVRIVIEEERIPVREEVRVLSEMLGVNPLEVANEGKVVMGVRPDTVDDVLDAIRSTGVGKNAEVIGVVEEGAPRVEMETEVGGRRIVEKPVGDPVPRVC
ncbi:hydrogenase expression/formation protein HypE [Methanopyrus sp.]